MLRNSEIQRRHPNLCLQCREGEVGREGGKEEGREGEREGGREGWVGGGSKICRELYMFRVGSATKSTRCLYHTTIKAKEVSS